MATTMALNLLAYVSILLVSAVLAKNDIKGVRLKNDEAMLTFVSN